MCVDVFGEDELFSAKLAFVDFNFATDWVFSLCFWPTFCSCSHETNFKSFFFKFERYSTWMLNKQHVRVYFRLEAGLLLTVMQAPSHPLSEPPETNCSHPLLLPTALLLTPLRYLSLMLPFVHLMPTPVHLAPVGTMEKSEKLIMLTCYKWY